MILLPRQFDDGRPVPDELLADVLLELELRQFGVGTSRTGAIRFRPSKKALEMFA